MSKQNLPRQDDYTYAWMLFRKTTNYNLSEAPKDGELRNIQQTDKTAE